MIRPGGPLEATTGPVLVVDDEPAVRGLFARALRDAGYETLQAADGVEALELLQSHSVALILLDSTMPRLGGAGVIRAVRQREATRTLPVILVTAKGDLADRVEGLEAGADDYLVKPVILDELVARVRAGVRSYATWRQANERQADDRRRMTTALRRVRGHGSLMLRASSLVEELMPALRLDGLALVAFITDERMIPLAMESSWPELNQLGRPGIASEGEFARGLRSRAAAGPWVRRLTANRRYPTPAGDREVAVLPLPGRDGPLGVILFGASVVRHEDGLAWRMPIFLEVADFTAALLGLDLEVEGHRLRARAALEAIIAGGAFTPHFQPLVSLANRVVVGYEALTRFADGTPPDIRFAEAARLDLGHELELATLRAAVQAARGLPSTTLLALNVSPSLVLAGQDLGLVLAARAQELVLEITEHARIDDYAALRAAIERIDPPLKVAVDDAGSGYASLSHILALRPAYVKLDLSWVRGIEADSARQAMVAGLVHFATEVGCRLIGEGIETEAELATLLRLGVPLGQGYLLGRPLPAPSP
jgi:EAL domain-containing protein (putative c-di-GMP-specific phosphodiesterase class I)/FixJ family two-component response regulator